MAIPCDKIERWFKEADINNSGTVSFAELCRVFEKHGLSKEQLIDIFLCTDENDDRELSLPEVKRAFSLKDPNEVKDDELRGCFKEMDTDGTGYLSADEIKKALQKLGVKGDPEKIIKQVDTNSDGKINIEEFIQAWHGGKK